MKTSTRVWITLAIIGVLAGVVCLLTLPTFYTKTIRIENTNRKQEYVVKELEKLAKGRSIFLVDRRKVKTEVEKDPYLIYKNVTYSLPNTLVIHVEERVPAYCVKYMNNYIYLTRDGMVISTQSDLSQKSVPMVTGMEITSFTVREKLNTIDNTQLAELTFLLGKLVPVGLADRISEIDVTDIINIKMKMPEGHEIIFGTTEKTEKKIEWIHAILNELGQQEGKKFSIDVSAPENPTYKEITQDAQ